MSNGLYTCGAKKGDRCYRYFVSRKLIREPGQAQGNNGWRLPAEETERAVLAGVKQILSDRRALASALKADGLGAADFPKVLEAAEAVAKAFGATGSMDDASGMVERVELRNDGIQITVNLQHLLPHERIEEGSELRMTRLIPMQMKRRGVETRLVIPGEAIVPARTDPALLRMLARGYQWFGELASGKVSSTRQIAMREGLSDSYVRHVVPLGLLAPELVESICAGNRPPVFRPNGSRRSAACRAIGPRSNKHSVRDGYSSGIRVRYRSHRRSRWPRRRLRNQNLRCVLEGVVQLVYGASSLPTKSRTSRLCPSHIRIRTSCPFLI